jgi:hypothetical protein
MPVLVLLNLNIILMNHTTLRLTTHWQAATGITLTQHWQAMPPPMPKADLNHWQRLVAWANLKHQEGPLQAAVNDTPPITQEEKNQLHSRITDLLRCTPLLPRRKNPLLLRHFPLDFSFITKTHITARHSRHMHEMQLVKPPMHIIVSASITITTITILPC